MALEDAWRLADNLAWKDYQLTIPSSRSGVMGNNAGGASPACRDSLRRLAKCFS